MSLVFIESRVLKEIEGIGHFFSKREGGRSRGSCGDLCLSNGGKDRPEDVGTNLDVLSEALGVSKKNFYWCQQAHTDRCLILEEKNKDKVFETEADAIITRMKNAVIGVRTADCCPILVADEKGETVAAVHAGWQGTVTGILGKVIAKMEKTFSLSPRSLKVSIGPSIGPCCYSIDESRAKHIIGKIPFAEDHMSSKEGHFYLDLKGLNGKIAMNSGVLESNVDTSDICTFCSGRSFFSFRRDGESSGRQFSGIWIR